MGSPFDDLFTDSAMPAIFAVHGGSVLRWPCGVEADAETVTATWEPDQTGKREFTSNAEAMTFFGTLGVYATQTVEKRDAWVIDDETWYVEELGKPKGGMRDLRLKRTEKITTTRTVNRR